MPVEWLIHWWVTTRLWGKGSPVINKTDTTWFMTESGPWAYRLCFSVCLFLHGADMLVCSIRHNAPFYSRLHLPPPTPVSLMLPPASFLFIFAVSSRVVLKLFRSVEIHQAWLRENNREAQVNRERRSRQRKQWSLNYWVPSFSITSHVPRLMACFFLSLFFFHCSPPSSRQLGW